MITEEEKELLSLAAKAAGLGQLMFAQEKDDDGYDTGVWKHCWYLDKQTNKWVDWNPLYDDGDALRLVVALGMMTDARQSVVAATCQLGSYTAHTAQYNHKSEAMRAAIVFAAVAVGRKIRND